MTVHWRRLFVGLVGLALIGAGGLFFWARAVLGGDTVRRAVEAQLSRALGQPVTIASVDATILPRVTMNLRDVAIGQPARVTIARLHVGTDFRALLSRRIEHAAVRLSGARVELPLPPLPRPATDAASAGTAPVEIVSVDAIDLTDAEFVSGGRVLRGDVRVVPVGRGLDVRRATLTAADTSMVITGAISDLAGPVGQLTLRAGGLNVLDLVAFATDFSAGLSAAAGATRTPAEADPVPMDLLIAISADRAQVGTLALDALNGRARITPAQVTLQPIEFGVFDGQYAGTLSFTPGATPMFHVKASVSGIDVASVMAYAESSDAITGRLTGTLDVTGRATRPVASARGRARLEIASGTVAGLNLVRTVVLAGSMRKDSQAQVSGVPARRAEPFDTLAATFAIGGGVARTEDLRFQSSDVLLTGVGAIELQARSVDLLGRLQLSDELSQQAGRDLRRYTRENGRVTLPVVITGKPGQLTVMLDVGDAARRAIVNRAAEEAKKAISRALGRIIK